MNIFNTLKTDDEYFTRYEAWADVAPYLPKTMVVWEAFYSPHSRSPTYLRELGFEVLSEPIDFFENNLGDCIISNPPYALKKEVFTRLKELDKPFCMLVPTTTLQTRYFKNLFGDAKIQVILPWRKREFDTADGRTNTKRCSFYTCYICYKMGLKKDLILV